MNKILLALAILGTGTGGFLTARHSTIRLQREASATRESWIVQTQVLTDAQGERARLSERISELKQSLGQAEAAGHQNGLWSVLETNRIGGLAPDLREPLLEELGFTWNSSEAFIVVSKETVRMMRSTQQIPIRQGKLIDSVAALLAMTPQERSQVEAALERVQADFKDWAISHTARSEPGDDVLAKYTLLQSYPATRITNDFAMEVFAAIGKERTDLLMPFADTWQRRRHGSIQHWMEEIGMLMSDKPPMTMILKRFSDGNKQVLKVQVDAAPWEKISKRNFPEAFLPLFPNGWADVAKREGFELPWETEHK